MSHMEANFDYDVCLSFAGEQRAYVNEVANLLRNRGVRVFYDLYEQAALWGKDLYEHLDEIYRKRARYCVLFASEDYARKVWTGHERQSAQARALTASIEYVLPARFDDTEIPGLRPSVGYLDLRQLTPHELVDLITQKLAPNSPQQEGEVANYSTAPLTEQEQEELLKLRPEGWEFFLYAGVLARGRAKHREARMDYELNYARYVRTIKDDREAILYTGEAFGRAISLSEDMEKVINTDAQDWAFGRPGEPGKVENIIHIGNRMVDIYRDFLAWAADLRGTRTNEELVDLYRYASLYADQPIRSLESFFDEYIERVKSLPELLQQGSAINLSIPIVLDVPEDISRQYSTELKRVTAQLGI